MFSNRCAKESYASYPGHKIITAVVTAWMQILGLCLRQVSAAMDHNCSISLELGPLAGSSGSSFHRSLVIKWETRRKEYDLHSQDENRTACLLRKYGDILKLRNSLRPTFSKLINTHHCKWDYCRVLFLYVVL